MHSHDSAPNPSLPLPPSPSVSWTGDIQETEKERQFADGKGEGAGVEPNHTTVRKLGPLYISQSSLWRTFGLKISRSFNDDVCLPFYYCYLFYVWKRQFVRHYVAHRHNFIPELYNTYVGNIVHGHFIFILLRKFIEDLRV